MADVKISALPPDLTIIATDVFPVVSDSATKKVTLIDLATALKSLIIPPGSVEAYAGITEPSSWLFCYGQAVSRTTYADLFTAISTTYGVGDGSTTFNLPDLRGRTIAGQDDMGGTSANRLTGAAGSVDGDILGGAGGAETHTLITAEMPAHTHTGFAFQTTGGGANITHPAKIGNTNATQMETDASTGGGGAHNNVQPTLILNYIIKT